jgi:two-component system, LytTR family, sensor kinase
VIGRRHTFCHNHWAMREEWREYWRHAASYKRYLMFGLVVSFLQFLLNLSYWREHQAIWKGLSVSLIFWLSIGFMIITLFLGVYAVLTAMRIRTGFKVRRFLLLDISITIVAVSSGILLALFLESVIFQEAIRISILFPAFIIALFIGTLFFLHIAYRRAKEEALQLQAVAAESKYNALEHQMRPHFLFNTLNSLAELIESGHEGAADMTHRLSDLYRQILANSKLKTATIHSECDIARRYLELEQLRFGTRLHFSIEIASDAQDIFIPSLTLQTLVENAVKHGIAKSVEGGTIKVQVCKTADQRYQLKVANTGAAYKENASTGTGLTNTRERLALLYGKAHQFNIDTNGEGTTVASFYFTGEKL